MHKAASAKAAALEKWISVESLRKEFLRKEGVTVSMFMGEQRLRRVENLLPTAGKRCFEFVRHLGLGREDVAARCFKKNWNDNDGLRRF